MAGDRGGMKLSLQLFTGVALKIPSEDLGGATCIRQDNSKEFLNFGSTIRERNKNNSGYSKSSGPLFVGSAFAIAFRC